MIGILTPDMKRVGNDERLGYIATVCTDDTPNLFAEGDDRGLGRRSPRVCNLARTSSVKLRIFWNTVSVPEGRMSRIRERGPRVRRHVEAASGPRARRGSGGRCEERDGSFLPKLTRRSANGRREGRAP